MIGAIKKIFFAGELRAKILFTLLMLLVCRIGAFVPVPGINQEA
ncbi:MAG: Protein translocase subunit SecY, partial [Candidatus Anoxychlamydiales bacterium]|nr:Protein translocase subunit SecY [Candidatus Anoxychlamydiales bacterium]